MSAAKRARDGEPMAESAAGAAGAPLPRRLTRSAAAGSAAAAADATADAADRFQWLVTRCAENGYAYDVSVAASVTPALRNDPVVWRRLAPIVVSRPIPFEHFPASLKQRYLTKLMHAAFVGDVARCKWLLDLGAQLEAFGDDGFYGRYRSPLMWAAEGGTRGAERAVRSLATVRFLLARGADPLPLLLRSRFDPALYPEIVTASTSEKIIAKVLLNATSAGHADVVKKYSTRVPAAVLRAQLQAGAIEPDALKEFVLLNVHPSGYEALQCLVRHDAFGFSDRVMVAGHTRDAAGFAELYAAAVGGGLAALPQPDLNGLFAAACGVGDVPRALVLLDAGASILAQCRVTEAYAVAIAAENGQAAIIRALCNRPGALGNAAAFRDNVGPFRDRAFSAAVRVGDVGLARRLLQAGADVESQAGDFGGDLPIDFAQERYHLEMMRLLVCDWGATFTADKFARLCEGGPREGSDAAYRSIVSFFFGRGAPFTDALHLFCAAKSGGNPSTNKIKLLLELGANANARYCGARGFRELTTPLLAAISSGHVEHVTAILEAGAHPRDRGAGKVAPFDAVGARVKDARAAEAMRTAIQRAIAERDE